MKKNKNENNLTFESAMIELEQLVDTIDNDKISLNEIVTAFERGTMLMNFCNKELSKVEDKISKLIKTKEGVKLDQ
tara:strand:- start:353 stop:580 length:228 start_codon:yes stop_codon:yes gene_type:complete